MLGNVTQTNTLLLAEVTGQGDGLADPVQEDVARLALCTITGVETLVPQRNHDGIERPALAACVQLNRHRRTRSKRPKQQLIRIRPQVEASDLQWLVHGDAVVPHLDRLRESLLTANDDFGHAMIKLCAWSGRSELAKRLRWAGGSR